MTAPTAPMDPAAQAPASDPSAAPADESQEQFVVCIAAQPDGTYSVYAQDSDDDQDDAAQGSAPAPGGDDSGPQTAQSLEDALKIAGQMLQEEAGEDSQEPADGSDPQAVWNQLAKKTDAKRGAM
jgi:hypothetical protein